MTIEPFRIEVSDAVLADLRERLARTRLPDQIEGAGWDYGTELSYLKELVAHWRDRFDWRKQEALLNSFPHFTTRIDDHRMHFIHARSPHAGRLPAGRDARLARLDLRVPQGARPADRSDAARRRRARRVPRRVSVDPRLRLLRGAAHARLGRPPHGRDEREADGAARLREVRRAGRRLGRDHLGAERARGPRSTARAST